MNKISLCWRITILIGALVLVVSTMLTALSIQNMTNSFVLPMMSSSVGQEDKESSEGNPILSFEKDQNNLPEDIHYAPEIKMNVEQAMQTFSITSYSSMALVLAVSMLAAYFLAGGSILVSSLSIKNEILIRISDTGIGIPADDLEKIFEPFYRADKSRSGKIAGSGLGLSITKDIFSLHNAAITINSEKRKGTIIEIWFKC